MERGNLRFRAFLWIVLAAFSFLAMAEQPAKTEQVAKFAWPVNGKARVTQTVSKKGKSIVIAYDMLIRPAPNSKNLMISFENNEFIKYAGVELKKRPDMLEKLKPLLAVITAKPDFEVSSTGELVKVHGTEALLDKIIEQKALGSADPNAAQKMHDAATTRGLDDLMVDESMMVWNAWVEAWIGSVVSEDSEILDTAEDEAFGKMIPWDISFYTMPPEPDLPKGTARFYLDMTAHKEPLKEAFKAAFKSLEPEGGQTEVTRLEKSVTMDIATDPNTLKPIWVIYEEYAKIQYKGQRRQEQVKRSKYEFDWSVN